MNSSQLSEKAPVPDKTFPSGIHIGLILFGFFAIAVVLHHQGFRSEMLFDSKGFIAEKVHVYSRSVTGVIRLVPARPLLMVSLYANYLSTGMDPYYFRLFNAAILAGSGLVLLLLCLLVLEMPTLSVRGTRREKFIVSFFVALLFVVHPLQTTVVLYIWQREAIMACFFYLSALAVYLGARQGRFSRTLPAYTLTSLLFFAGIASKENAATLPVVLVLAELILLGQSLGQVLRRAVNIALICLPPLLIYFLLASHFHGPDSLHPSGILNRVLKYYGQSGLDPVQVALTECRIAFSYIAMISAPFLYPTQLIKTWITSRSLIDPPATLVACSGVLGLLGAALGCVRRNPVVAFGIFFFFVTLLPESLLIPQYLSFGYRAVLPMVGVLLIGGVAVLYSIQWLQEKTPSRLPQYAIATFGLSLAVCFSLLTLMQARSWGPLQVWKEAYDRLPRFTKGVEHVICLDVVGNLSTELCRTSRYNQAIEVIQKSFGIDPYLDQVQRGPRLPGEISKRQGIAPILMEAAERVPEKVANVYTNLGLALRESGHLNSAVKHYEIALSLHPDSVHAYCGLGLAMEESGDLHSAVDYYSKALRLKPDLAELYYNLANALFKSNNVDGAIANYQKALELKPQYAEASANLAKVHFMNRRFSEAIFHFRRALQHRKDDAELHNLLGVALAETGEADQAAEHFSKALAIDPQNEEAKQNLLATGKSVNTRQRLDR